MDLHILWFILIAVLFAGFFMLEGFDYGVGILLPFLGKTDEERRVVINSIGPFWDANEVWLIVAGGAMFAAFPHWYATLFSGFYIALFLILVALILRGVAFEFRSKHETNRWRRFWDAMIFVGSIVPSFLWGVAIAHFIAGAPINEKMQYTGTIWDQLSPFALLTGCAFVIMFALHGAIFLSLKTEAPIMERARRAARRLWLPAVVLAAVFVVGSYLSSNAFQRLDAIRVGVLVISALAILSTGLLLLTKREGWAFTMSCVTILLTAVVIASGMFPNVMISTLNPAWNLTIYNASSSSYTLQIISWVSLSALPFVLLYQAWNYWVFRKRVGGHSLHY
ncbi:cytochrome d ubiquinol oxidase subunit II [Thermosporothrix hazakensis]|jgi:cytochrome d ubiquinol oxidase subunit II|uniref:Cytochrome d ubiquinol oxidase subunit II n=2 Tax=Thermosporothrix TaxID=768650 RepID=A0A326TZQ4_THEHA|nr:cytochrome d ubiquinol oxidase subunit II [Thermosporothrix hazakensis]PZW22930.1 cytochrome d ubiquinol oxidase subunit II [Thermosporothrix hazakensis]BBH89792.1 cytochrome c oxidase assembly protein [Thermosporothrix sp. COM3]GCE47981.1 cytochrome c oxidase assembly protein [Thermosporothrix hazakensis]